MILDFGAKSIPSGVLSLFPCGRLHSLLFAHGRNLSQESTNQFCYGAERQLLFN